MTIQTQLMREINCPICGEKMLDTCSSPNLYLCNIVRNTYMPKFRKSVEHYDCAIEIFPEVGYIFQRYVIMPYRVYIRNLLFYPTIKYSTVIEKVVDLKKLDYNYEYIEWKKVFRSTLEIKFPWHDHDKCVEKIKKMILFS